MLKSVQYSEELPPAYSDGDPVAERWKDSYEAAYRVMVDDVGQLIRDTQAFCPLPLLNMVQIEPQLWAKPSHLMGGLRFIGNEDYLLKTNRPTMTQNHEAGIYNRCYGLELEFSMMRRLFVKGKQPPFNVWPSAVYVKLVINGEPELTAAQEVYRDWRGLVKKLLEGTRLEANSCCDVIPEMERVRSKQPIPKLDVMLNLPNREDFIYQLEFPWHHDSDWAVCQKSFLALAVLFTCIQKAATAPRSRKEHLLDYWLALEKYSKPATRSGI